MWELWYSLALAPLTEAWELCTHGLTICPLISTLVVTAQPKSSTRTLHSQEKDQAPAHLLSFLVLMFMQGFVLANRPLYHSGLVLQSYLYFRKHTMAKGIPRLLRQRPASYLKGCSPPPLT